MNQATVQPEMAWGLWDAGELISLHLTSQAASDAREAHLDRYLDFSPEDLMVALAAVEIREVCLYRGGEVVDDRGRGVRAGHDSEAVSGRNETDSTVRVGGGRHAGC